MRTTLRPALFAAVLSPTMAVSAFAIDTSSIKPHMEVVGEDGVHVGTVDKIEGDQMILTKNDPAAGGVHHRLPITAATDPAAGGVHHRLPITAATNVTNAKVMLRGPAANAMAAWLPVEKPGDDKAK